MTDFVDVKTSGLTGAELDWVVAQVEKIDGLVIHKGRPAFERNFDPDCWADETDIEAFKCWQFYTPSTDWGQGGPMILSRGVSLRCIAPLNAWEADCWDDSVVPSRYCQSEAETPLIASCRAIVASVLGDTVSVPKEFLS